MKINQIESNETVDWRLMAYDVLLRWTENNPEAHSLELLAVLNKTSPQIAENFHQDLTCGKNRFQFLKDLKLAVLIFSDSLLT